MLVILIKDIFCEFNNPIKLLIGFIMLQWHLITCLLDRASKAPLSFHVLHCKALMVQCVLYSEPSVKWRKQDRGLQVFSGCFNNIPLWFRLFPNDSCEVGYICKMDLSETESLTVLRLCYNTVQRQEKKK